MKIAKNTYIHIISYIHTYIFDWELGLSYLVNFALL